MDFDIIQIGGLWHAKFSNGHVTDGYANANVARGAAYAYIQSQAIKAGK